MTDINVTASVAASFTVKHSHVDRNDVLCKGSEFCCFGFFLVQKQILCFFQLRLNSCVSLGESLRPWLG